MIDDAEVILVDIGNSSIKTTEVLNGNFQKSKVWDSLKDVLNLYQSLPMIISSVRRIEEELTSKPESTTILTYHTSLPIELDYATPETLGPDRIAAAVGANALFPDTNNLVVDLGTCMTADLVDSSGVFRGGVISPGLTMRMKAMSHYTDKLPDISEEWRGMNVENPGKTTKECMLLGSLNGIIHEINGIVRTLEKDFTSLNTILTGGDAHFFESKLKAHIFAGSKIVQTGLYNIWKYQ